MTHDRQESATPAGPEEGGPAPGQAPSTLPPWGTPEQVPVWGTPEIEQVPAWGTPPPPRRRRDLRPAVRPAVRSKGAWAWLTAAVGTAALIAIGAFGPDDGGTKTVTLDQLKAGDCIQASSDGSLNGDIPVVACTATHQEEVVGVFDLPSSPWPGDAAAQDAIDEKCSPLFATYAGASADSSALAWYGPSEEDWSGGQRRVVCVEQTLPGSSTSVRQSGVGN